MPGTTDALPTIAAVARALDGWAAPGSAQSYDNVGLQVGDAARTVQRAVVAVDLTHDVIDEAKTAGAGLIVTHHPLIFRPLKRVAAGAGPSGMAYRLAAEGIALYSIHTNLDAAPGGVSFALAERLGLMGVRFLDPLPGSLYRVDVTARRDALDRLRPEVGPMAHHAAVYDVQASSPSGAPGDASSLDVAAARLSLRVARWDVDRLLRIVDDVLGAGVATCDVHPVEQGNDRAGLGAIGRLASPEPLSAFLRRVARRLDTGSLRYAGDPDALVETVAVCGGAGSDLIGAAKRAGADAYVTADVTYHRFFDVLDAAGRPAMALIDAGHYETEAVTEALLVAWLSDQFPAVAWQRTRHRTSPVRTFCL